MKVSTLLAGASAVLVVCSNVAAQDSTRVLPEIVVTATRTPMPREVVTSSVTVLQGAALRARGLNTVADALRELPEAAIVRSGSFGGQTGLFLRGGESNFTRVLVDGVPVNEPGGSFDFATLSLDNVERIEVLRGPASVLYGSDAVSGVVQVITKGAGGGGGGAAELRMGTYGTVAAAVSGQGTSGPARWSAAASRYATDGIYAFNSQFDNLVGSLRFGFDVGTTSIDLTTRYSDGTYHFPTDGAGNLVDANQRQQTETTTLGLEVAHRVRPGLEARVQLSQNRIGGGLDDQPDDLADTLGFFSAVTDRTLMRRTADARLNIGVGRDGLVTAGASLEQEQEVSASRYLSSFGPFSAAFDARRRNVAGYIQAIGRTGAVALSAGARVDENERFGTFGTVRGGAAVRLATGTRLRASAGTGFKEPTFFENYGGSGVVGNADLAPERAVTWDVGVEQPLGGGRVRLDASWFMQRFHDLIEYIGVPATAGGANYVNVAAASADGLEFSADVRLPSPFSRLTLRYTRLWTAVTEAGTDPTFAVGQDLVRRPLHAASVRVSVVPLPSVTLAAGARHTGTRVDLDYGVVDFITVFDPARVRLSAYTVFDAAVTWTVMHGIALDASVQNLFAATYAEVLGFPAPGRTILIGARVGR